MTTPEPMIAELSAAIPESRYRRFAREIGLDLYLLVTDCSLMRDLPDGTHTYGTLQLVSRDSRVIRVISRSVTVRIRYD